MLIVTIRHTVLHGKHAAAAMIGFDTIIEPVARDSEMSLHIGAHSLPTSDWPKWAVHNRAAALTDETYINRLERELSITPGQAAHWRAFAAALDANASRMAETATWTQAGDGNDDGLGALDAVFGPLELRLAALSMMRSSAGALFAVLSPSQRHLALRALPLCCLPMAH
jgi:hypothetical protein